MINPQGNKVTDNYLGVLWLLLISIFFAIGWFLIFILTGHPWDSLGVFAGWGIARILSFLIPGGTLKKPGFLAVLLMLAIIAVHEYLILSLVSSYDPSTLPSGIQFSLIPFSFFLTGLRDTLSANPFPILMWMLSCIIAYITAISIKRK